MASSAQICNLALSHIELTETSIANLTTDTGAVATQCRIHYDVAREFVLADHDWGFAEAEVILADVGAPSKLWAYRYDYPSTCKKIREIQRLSPEDRPVPFKIQLIADGSKKSILTDMPQAVGIYTSDVTNTTLFSPGFTTALSWYLAAELVPALGGGTSLREQTLRVYQGMIAAAQAQDAQEQRPREEIDASWIAGR